MKKRFLPIGFFIFTIGIASILLSAFVSDKDKKPAGKSETATEYLSRLRNNQLTGMINPKDIMQAREQVKMNQDFKSGRSFDLNWKTLGPNNMGGRTRALLFDNRDATDNTIFAGSVLGGMFKTTNGGEYWTRIDLEDGNLNVTCLTQASDGTIYAGTGEGFTVEKFTILDKWGYTGGFAGQGLFKSTDGENFTLIESTRPTLNGNNVLEWGFINELAVYQGRIYASTNTGLKYSDDGGNIWQISKTSDGADLNLVSKEVKTGQDGYVIAEVNNLCYISQDGNAANFVIHSSDSTIDLPAYGIGRIEFAIAPADNNIIYALVVTTTGALKNVYRSSDKGATWNIIGPGGSANFNVFNTGNIISEGVGIYACTIEVFPVDPNRIIIGGLDMWEGKKIQEDGFYQWTLRSFGTYNVPLLPNYLPQNQHAYKFVPGTAEICFIATNGGISKGILAPDGFSFQVMNKDYIASQFYTVTWTINKKNVMGGAQDLGTVFIDGQTNPTDGKRGEDIWTTASALADGKNGGFCAKSTIFPTAAVYSRYPHPAKNGNLETFVRRNEFGGGPDWSGTMFSDKYASIAFLSPFLLWENYEDYNSHDSVGLKILKDTPAGTALWLESNNGKHPFKYITPEALQKGDSIVVPDIISTRFFIGGDNQVLMTKHIIQYDRTPEWYVISDAAHSGISGTPQCMAYSKDANHLFVGTIQGKLYRISNIAYAWNFERADVTSPYCVISSSQLPIYLPGTTTEISQVITSVSVNPNNPNNVIVTLGNYGNEHYVFMTNNALNESPEFISIQGNSENGGLPLMPVYSSLIEMDPNNHLVFAGTEKGIYVSDNVQSANPTWSLETNNIGDVPVFMLVQQTIRKEADIVPIGDTYMIFPGPDNYGVIYGATYGRGLIALDEFQKPVGIDEPGNYQSKVAEFQIYPNPAQDYVTLSYTLESSSKVEMNIFDLQGKMAKTMHFGQQPAGKHEPVINCADLPSGTYLIQLVTGKRSSSSKFIIY